MSVGYTETKRIKEYTKSILDDATLKFVKDIIFEMIKTVQPKPKHKVCFHFALDVIKLFVDLERDILDKKSKETFYMSVDHDTNVSGDIVKKIIDRSKREEKMKKFEDA